MGCAVFRNRTRVIPGTYRRRHTCPPTSKPICGRLAWRISDTRCTPSVCEGNRAMVWKVPPWTSSWSSWGGSPAQSGGRTHVGVTTSVAAAGVKAFLRNGVFTDAGRRRPAVVRTVLQVHMQLSHTEQSRAGPLEVKEYMFGCCEGDEKNSRKRYQDKK